MVGKIKWNFYFAFGGMFVVFLLAWKSNLFHTALIRSMYSFVILFMIMFLIRYILGMIKVAGEDEGTADEESVGTHVDLSTPEDDSIQQLLSTVPEEAVQQTEAVNDEPEPAEHGDFQPIKPPKLASKESVSPENLADVVRQMSEREGR